MRILIAGDSWGIGECNLACDQVLHSGLQNYINDQHQVVNISCGGISNLDIANRLDSYLQRNRSNLPDKILVFQTEYTRDFRHQRRQLDYGANDWQQVQQVRDLQNMWIERFYFRLSEIAIKYECLIYLVGGCSDTMWFDDMSQDYPGCNIICQSLTNLLIRNESYISDPVYSWYTVDSEPLIQQLRSHLASDIATVELIEQIHRGFEREALLLENPDLFYPDGKHPNRKGHWILYQYLQEKHFFDV